MEIYTLDRRGNLEDIVEGVISFIWTERRSEYGDFELVVPSNSVNRARYVPDVRLIQSLSTRVMIINHVENAKNDSGLNVLTVKGYSIEALMMDKVARSNASSYPYKWRTERPPASMMRNLYHEIMYLGVRSPKDILADVAYRSSVPVERRPEPAEPVQFEFEPVSVYEKMSEIGKIYDLGFSITRDHTTGVMTFQVYSGYDRTTSQSTNAPVLFSTSLDNLQNTRELKSNVGFKNVALAYSEQGLLEVHAPGVSTGVSSAERRVMIVKVDTLQDNPTPAQITAHLMNKGRDALAMHRMVSAFDGEISQHSPYIYGVHFGLGDLVEFQNEDGVSNIMLTTEQTFSLDAQGFRSWPTLSLHVTVTPGSWISWDQNREWDDMTTEAWNALP